MPRGPWTGPPNEMALVLGFCVITELPRVVLGVVVPVQIGTEFGVPEPLTCAKPNAERAMKSKALKKRNPKRVVPRSLMCSIAFSFHDVYFLHLLTRKLAGNGLTI